AISNLSSPLHRHDLVALDRLGGAERRPGIHQPTPLVEQVAAPVRGLDLGADDVRQRHLGNLAREVRSFGCPIAKARSEAVNGDAVTHVNQQLPRCVDVERAAEFRAGENQVSVTRQYFEQVNRSPGEWHAVWLAAFHALGRNSPRVSADLGPTCPDSLTDAGGCQDRELKRTSYDALLAA